MTTLESGENDLSWDAGLVKLAAIGDRIWYDNNANGVQDAGEAGVAGVTVELRTNVAGGAGGTVLQTRVTDANGDYLFDNLTPGAYHIDVVESTLPAGYEFTTPNAGADDAKDSDVYSTASIPLNWGVMANTTLDAGEVDRSWDAGIFKRAALGDKVWLDLDADGVQDAGEAGVAGVKVNLLNAAGSVVATDTTDASGEYLFEGLLPGDYRVAFDLSTLPAGYSVTTRDAAAATDATDSDADAVTGQTVLTTLSSGEVDRSWDMGIHATLGVDIEKYVRGRYFVQDSGDGTEGLTPGFWKTHSSYGPAPLSGWPETGYNPDQGYEAIFGVSITGSEPTLLQALGTSGGGMDALLRHSAAALLNAANPSVDYEYTVAEVIAMTQAAFASGNYEATKNLFAAQNELGADLSTPAATGGYWVETADQDADSPTGPYIPVGGQAIFTYVVKNTGSVALSDVKVTDDRIANLQFVGGDTDGDGKLDTNETWTYTASEAVQTGVQYVNTGTVVGTDAVSGRSATDSDLAHYTTSSLGQTLGDRVWLDTNANGVQDAGEAGVAGVTVQLKNAAGTVLKTTTTDANGNYLFDVAANTNYLVSFITPAGYVATVRDAGGNDLSDSDIDRSTLTTGLVSVGAGQQNLSVDAGLVQLASLGDKVWLDCNSNGIQDSGEQGVAGVTVRLLDSTGSVLATQTTDANGNYLFSNLMPGAYAVQFVPLSGYDLTVANAGANDAADSDADAATGKTGLYTLVSGQSNTTVDAGLTPVCRPVTFDFSGNTATDGTDGNVRTYTDALTGVSVTARAFSQDKGTNTWQTAFVGAYGGGLGVTDSSEGTGSGNSHTVDNVGRNNYIVLQFSQAVRVDELFLGYVVGDSDVQVWVGNSATTLTSLNNSVLAGMAFTEVDTTTLTGARSVDVNDGGVRGNILIIAADTTDGTPDDYFKLQNVSVCAPDYCNPVAKASIGNFVWYDKDADGIQDSGEAGIAGVTVNLLNSAGTVLASTTTDANGQYLFSNLNPADYSVQVVAQDGFAFTRRDIGSNNNVDSDADASGKMALTTLSAGENDLSWDAGVYKVGVDIEKYVSGVRTTSNNNCGGEGANVSYWKSNCSWQSSLGDYGWANTGVKYSLSFNSVFGVNCSGGTQNLYTVLNSTKTDTLSVMMREAVAAYLNACHTSVSYAFTKDQVCADVKHAVSSGNYSHYTNCFAQENSLGCNWSTGQTTWSSVTDTTLYDSDAPPGLEVVTGSTVTFTYIVRNTGDTALKNVVVTDDRIATVSYVSGDTDNDGLLDTNESWVYKATEVASSGTIKNTGTVTATDAVGGTAKVTDADDAYYTGQGNNTTTKGSIGDRLWEDADFDGIQDAGEKGIAGVKVTLKGAGVDGSFGTGDDITATTTTNSSGNYEFTNLAAGKYQVVFGDGSFTGYYATKQNQGGNDAVDSDVGSNLSTGTITLAAGEHNLTVDAGVYRKASVGDKVWDDQDHDNVQDAGELGIAGITVKLYSSTGTLIGTTTTNSNGNYLFSNLDPGSYFLQFDKTNVYHWNYNQWNNMSNWKWAKKDQGSNDAIDSDVNGDAVSTANVTTTSVFTLTSGMADMTKDAGITPIVIDLDGNGIQTLARDASDATFDLFGNGSGVKSGWISGGDGFLAVDKDGNGKIDDISELFGGTAKGAGFAQLASYDSNGDGQVNAADAQFDQLRVWVDGNGNHQTDDGELLTLAQAGVAALTVGYTELPFLDAQGNLHLERSSATLADGSSVDMTDVYFNVDAADAAAAGVALPTLAELMGDDRSLDAVLGSSPAAAGTGCAAHAGLLGGDGEAWAGCGDATEALRRLAALSTQESHASAH
ncbi:MAG: carboxypeptidase regulatory-like domain-containing protein [Burkholderiaceae bacterium]|nr:carboxypeptidase regulatory-like domain-containing protein [Burkholderiaceae bacterium]